MQAAPLGRGSERPGLAAPHPRCPLLPTGAVQPRPPPPPMGGPRLLPVPVLTSRAQWTAGKPGGSQGGRGSSKHVGRGPQGPGRHRHSCPHRGLHPVSRAPHSVPCAGLGVPHTAGHVAPFFPPPPNALACSLPTQPSAPSAGDATRSPRSSSPLVTRVPGPHASPFPQPHHPRGGALKDGAGSRPSLCPSVRPNGPREPMARARTAQSPGGPTCTAITDRTSTEIRLNSSKQPQAPVWARPL